MMISLQWHQFHLFPACTSFVCKVHLLNQDLSLFLNSQETLVNMSIETCGYWAGGLCFVLFPEIAGVDCSNRHCSNKKCCCWPICSLTPRLLVACFLIFADNFISAFLLQYPSGHLQWVLVLKMHLCLKCCFKLWCNTFIWNFTHFWYEFYLLLTGRAH